MAKSSKTSLILTMDASCLTEFLPLLQQGIEVEAHVGCTLESLLSSQWDITSEYAASRITTIFLNGCPVDDLSKAVISDDAVLALSGAMPGLVGATMRRGGYYAAMRDGITHRDSTVNTADRLAKVRVKLFNLLLNELGPGFLKRGINIPAAELSEFIKSRGASFWQSLRSALFNNYPLLPPALLRDELFPPDSKVRLSVNFFSP